jgi:hypothetical protein
MRPKYSTKILWKTFLGLIEEEEEEEDNFCLVEMQQQNPHS